MTNTRNASKRELAYQQNMIQKLNSQTRLHNMGGRGLGKSSLSTKYINSPWGSLYSSNVTVTDQQKGIKVTIDSINPAYQYINKRSAKRKGRKAISRKALRTLIDKLVGCVILGSIDPELTLIEPLELEDYLKMADETSQKLIKFLKTDTHRFYVS